MAKNKSKTVEEALADDETVVTLPPNTRVKFHKEAVHKAMEKAAQANADVKSALNAAENEGMDKKALKATIKSLINPPSDEHKVLVDKYRVACGALPLFGTDIDAEEAHEGEEE